MRGTHQPLPVTAAKPELMEGVGLDAPLTLEQPLRSWRYSRASEKRLWESSHQWGWPHGGCRERDAHPSTHPSPWAAGRPGSGMATQHRAFSRRCSRKSWVTCASGSTAAQRGDEHGYPTPKRGCSGDAGVTWVAGRAVNGLPRDTLHSPVPVHEEAVAQGVAEPLHGRGHGPTVGQSHAPGAAEEGALWGEQGVRVLWDTQDPHPMAVGSALLSPPRSGSSGAGWP